MWETEHSTETDLPIGDLWKTFTDIHSGKISLPGGDIFEPEGTLAVGTRIKVTPAGQDTMTSTVTEFEENARYADETEYNGLLLTFRHVFTPVGSGTQISHQLTISGEAADKVGPEIGPQISADFPNQMDALIAVARGQ